MAQTSREVTGASRGASPGSAAAARSGGVPEPERRNLAAGLVSVALFFLLGTGLYFTNPASRRNTVQTATVAFFALLLVWQFIGRRQTVSPEKEESAGSGESAKALLWPLLAGALAYASTLTFFFVSDDFAQLRKAARPLAGSIWQQIINGQTDAQGFHLFYRPLGFTSLFLEYRLFHFWTPGYHLNNLAWHLLATAALFLFCDKLGLRKRTCAIAALLFALMPVNVETVTWIGCRFDRLAITFMLWATVFYVWHRREGGRARYALALILFVLATVSKETAYVLPLLWLALDFIVLRDRRFRPVVGYLAVAGLSFIWRWHVLGGIGGYRMANGAPAARHLGKAAMAAVLLREPGELMFGYNWLQPGNLALVIAAAATAALLLVLAVFARRTPASRRLIWFSLIWIFLAGVPAHFLFWTPDTGLTFSRVLYAGSAGLALLIAVLIENSFSRRRLQYCWAGALACVFALALLHNLGAWRWNSELSHNFLAELRQIAPSPPPRTTFLIEDMPLHSRGVPIFEIGLLEGVQLNYGGRNDVRAFRVYQLPPPEPGTIRLRWTGNLARPVEPAP